MMRYYSTFLGLFVMLLFGCASTAPLPPTINIVPPAAEVPPEIAVFSGIWEGKLVGQVDTILIVEKINTEAAEVIISIGEWFGVESRFFYLTTKVLPGPAIEWINPKGNIITYKMNKDLKSISSVIEEKSTGAKFQSFMTRSKSQ